MQYAPPPHVTQHWQIGKPSAKGRRGIVVAQAKGAAEAGDKASAILTLPEMSATVTPIVYAVPVQLLAYHAAVQRGTDVDQPRNLAKSVTVE